MANADGPFDPNIFDPSIFDTGGPLSFDSYDWTGIQGRLASNPHIVDQIAKNIAELDRLLDSAGLTNSENAQAKAITTALLSLVDSPQPEWRAIVELLNSPIITAICNVSTVAALVTGVIELITSS